MWEEGRTLGSAFNLPLPSAYIPAPASISLSNRSSRVRARRRRAPEHEPRVEMDLRKRGRLPAQRIWRARRCIARVAGRVRVCAIHTKVPSKESRIC